MNLSVKLITTLEECTQGEKWFLEGDLSLCALDTETMGKNWFITMRKIREASDPQEIRRLEGELKEYKMEALSPLTNHLATIQLATADERVLFIILKDPEVVAAVQKLLLKLSAIPDIVFILQNAKFDLKQFAHHWHHHFYLDTNLHDTMLAETLIIADRGPERVSLRDIAERYKDKLPAGWVKGEAKAAVSDWWSEPLTPEQIFYGAMDVLLLIYIYRIQLALLTEKGLNRAMKLENKLVPCLVSMERNNLRFDKGLLEEFLWQGGAKLKDYAKEFYDAFGEVNSNSPAQVLKAIENRFGFTPMSRHWDGQQRRFVETPSVDKDTLLEAGLRKHPEIQALIALKELHKNLQTAKKWINDPYGCFRPEFIQVKRFGESGAKDGGTRTGRLSSSPNIQNIPDVMKQFLIPPDGYSIVSADYSAIELRLIASYANEVVLKEAFNQNRDPHTEMAAWAFQMAPESVGKKSRERRIAKEVNFGFIYGMSGRTFCLRVLRATNGDIALSLDEGNEFRNKFFERYPAIERWHRAQFANACFSGMVTTRSGRRREYNRTSRPQGIETSARIYNPTLNVWRDSVYASDYKWKNISYNTPIQGSGGDGVKRSIILLEQARLIDPIIAPFATVHDSNDGLVKDELVEKAARLMNEKMIEGMRPYLPDVDIGVEVTAGKSWANGPGGWDGVSNIREVASEHGLWFQTQYQKQISV